MKKYLLVIACMCLFLSACGGNDGYYYKEEEIIAFVQEHEEEIRQQIEDAGEDERIEEFDGIESVEDRRDTTDGVIYYEYIASGLMTSSLQAGFYYSVEDKPTSSGGASWAGGYGWSEVPTQEENLWRYEEEAGDNYCITRKICDNFYYVVVGN